MTPETLLTESQINAAIDAMARRILAQHEDPTSLVFIGILTNGYPLARRLANALQKHRNYLPPVGRLDVSLYRDDIAPKNLSFVTVRESEIPFEITKKIIILVDDVLFTGRTVRSAMDGLMDFGRPSKIELAVLIDRGHRDLPISPNYVGETIRTQKSDTITVNLYEVHAEDKVILN